MKVGEKNSSHNVGYGGAISKADSVLPVFLMKYSIGNKGP